MALDDGGSRAVFGWMDDPTVLHVFMGVRDLNRDIHVWSTLLCVPHKLGWTARESCGCQGDAFEKVLEDKVLPWCPGEQYLSGEYGLFFSMCFFHY